VVQIKALACELPSQQQVPLARWSVPEIARHAVQTGLVASISDGRADSNCPLIGRNALRFDLRLWQVSG
jgi:hypothetical protein